MVCPVCHQTLAESAKFCSNCGAKLSSTGFEPTSTLSQDAPATYSSADPNDRTAIEQLLYHQRYAAALTATAASVDPALVQLRQEAERHFDAGIQQIIAIYQRRRRAGLQIETSATAMIPHYGDEIEGIYETDERAAYAAALLDLATRKLADGTAPHEIQVCINAAYTLMEQDDQSLRAAAERLQAQLVALPQPDADAQTTVNGITGILSRLDTQPAAAEQLLPPARDQYMTVQLTPAMLDESLPALSSDAAADASPDEPLSVALAASRDEPEPAQAALQQLEMLLLSRAEASLIQAQLDQTRALIGKDSPYLSRLRRAEAQQRALQTLPAFSALLGRPLAEWLSDEQDLEAETSALLAEIEVAFDSDAPIAQELRAQREQRLQERNLIIEKIAGLDDLHEQTLSDQLAELERALSPAFPALAAAQQRRQQFEETRARQQQEKQASELAAAKRQQHRQLRLKLDNLILSPLPDPSELIELRNAAAAAVADTAFASAEHPLDPATFDYYDLYYASRYYDITSPSEKAEAGQTAVNAGDLLAAYRYFKEDLAEALRGDSPEHRIVAERNVQAALKNLVAKLEQVVSAAITDAEERLKRFDYAAVTANLQAQRRNVEDAEVAIDAALQDRIDVLLAEAQQVERQGQQVQELLAESSACVPSDGSAQNYPQAIALLNQALGIALWRDAELADQIVLLRERQERYVIGQIRRADDARRGGAYEEAERLLQRAEANIGTDEQRQQIDALRGTIFQQQENQRNINRMIEAAQGLAKAAEDGENLDLLAGSIAGERERIGTRDNPKVDNATWATLNTYVMLAEERLAIWKTYQRRLSQAEQAAFLGDRAAFDAAVQQMNEMTEHRFLPVDNDLKRIRQTARANSRGERARQLLNDIREELETPGRSVAPDRISQVLLHTRGLNDEDIVAERQLLESIYPLYLARTQLAEYAAQQLFAQLKIAYDRLAPEIQQDAVVSRLAQEAELALARRSFDERLKVLLRSVHARFVQGWDDPAGFREGVDEIMAFAEQAPADQRQDLPRLAPATLDQLENLASQLSSARADYDHYRNPDAHRRVKTILQTLPHSEVLASNLLASYYADLKPLRDQMQQIEPELVERINHDVIGGKDYTEVTQSYTACVSELKTAFNKFELQRVLARFVNLTSPAHLAAVNEYKAAITAITQVVQQVNEIEDLMISGSTSEQEGVAASGPSRKRLVEAQLNEVLRQSQAIQQTPLGLAWLGIADDRKYQALREHLALADALEKAAVWLSQTTTLPRHHARLVELRSSVEQLQALNLKPKDRDTLNQANLQRLAEVCEERWLRVLKRKTDLQRALDQYTARRHHIGRSLGAATLVALLGISGWSTPTVRNTVIAAAIGTLTPTPTQAPPPSSTANAQAAPTALPVTATPPPTETPVPTPTPVPPQAGIVIVPGRANVRAQPDLSLDPITFVETGDEVEVTGFVESAADALWYRLDVPQRNLRDVWLLSQITVQGRLRETVRFESGATLRQELRLQVQP